MRGIFSFRFSPGFYFKPGVEPSTTAPDGGAGAVRARGAALAAILIGVRPARSPALSRGVFLAAVAALLFGATTPWIARAGRGLGPAATAALLYAGAAVMAALLRLISKPSGARLGRRDVPRLFAIALAGGAVAPVLLAWGLPRAGATAASLVLNLEAAFTLGLARLVYREPISRRVLFAIGAMLVGGTVLVLDAARVPGAQVAGLAAIAGATFAWAADNTLSRKLADADPLEVVGAKGALGFAMTASVALVGGEPLPSARAAALLLACGATGYGVSLRCYLLAQRSMGTARTASVFAIAPFIGALASALMGDSLVGPAALLAAGCFAAGVALHLTERHSHEHTHEPMEHAHAHRHDDGHHAHGHDPPVEGEHTHEHAHGRLTHAHEHAPDLHHDHAHD